MSAAAEPTAGSAPAPRGPGARWGYALAWLPYFSIYLAAFLASGVPLGLAARNAVAYVLPDALLGIALLGLPRRLPWPVGARARFFALHAALVAAFLLASAAGWALLVGLDSLLFSGAFQIHLEPRFLIWRGLSDLLIYGTLAGLGYAWHNAAASREQAARAVRAEALRAQSDALRARAELEAMRSQLNPHFILNTFHALVGLVRRDPALAEEALERLGDLLRYSLRIQREGLDEVTLGEEWSFVESYLDLERLRLGERLSVRLAAEEGTLDCLVPSFALQTLVENAVRHAIAPRAEGGRLEVSACQADGRLRLAVEDDGRGVTGAASAASPESLESPESPEESKGLGLRLLRERLAALYDGQAILSLDAAAGGGVRARLELPARRLAEPAEEE